MKIIFAGDINFRDKELTYGESLDILSEVQPYIKAVDFVIPNLECPLADKERHKAIKKAGPNLICTPKNILFLNAMNAYAVTLANNHIGDFGEGAICDTLDLLKENKILYAGAGRNINEAYNAFYIKKEGICISVLSICENEFGIASETKYGSAGYNPRFLLNKIKAEKNVSDYVIVVFHGGNEFDPLPSPDTVDRYRMICDMGADAVIGGHTHCPQGYEIYNGKPIIYSMGNFLFESSTERKENDSWYYGYMCILEIKDTIHVQIVPYRFNKEATKIHIFEGTDKEKFIEYIDSLSKIIKKPQELKDYFSGWAYLHRWCPVLSEDNSCENYDLVSCESHLSQLKENLRILYRDEIQGAIDFSEKIIKLQDMPI